MHAVNAWWFLSVVGCCCAWPRLESSLQADVVKTRLQMPFNFHEHGLPGSNADAAARRSIPNVVSHIYQQHGVAGFFSGLTARVVKRIPQQVIAWTLYKSLQARSRD